MLSLGSQHLHPVPYHMAEINNTITFIRLVVAPIHPKIRALVGCIIYQSCLVELVKWIPVSSKVGMESDNKVRLMIKLTTFRCNEMSTRSYVLVSRKKFSTAIMRI